MVETARKGSIIFLSYCGSLGGKIGGLEGSGKSLKAFLYNPRIITILVITVLVLVTICYYDAR